MATHLASLKEHVIMLVPRSVVTDGWTLTGWSGCDGLMHHLTNARPHGEWGIPQGMHSTCQGMWLDG